MVALLVKVYAKANSWASTTHKARVVWLFEIFCMQYVRFEERIEKKSRSFEGACEKEYCWQHKAFWYWLDIHYLISFKAQGFCISMNDELGIYIILWYRERVIFRIYSIILWNPLKTQVAHNPTMRQNYATVINNQFYFFSLGLISVFDFMLI